MKKRVPLAVAWVVLVATGLLLVLSQGSDSGWLPPHAHRPAGQPWGVAEVPVYQTRPPKGYRQTAVQIDATASANSFVKKKLTSYPTAVEHAYTLLPPNWQVSWFVGRTEVLRAYVSEKTGVSQVWAGQQVGWVPARGYTVHIYGYYSNSWWVWAALGALFLLPFLPQLKLTWGVADLGAVLWFGVSLYFFNLGKIGVSVPLFYLPLLYILGRLIALGLGKASPPQVRVGLPIPLMVGLGVGIECVRVAVSLGSPVTDVGFAGAVGALKIQHLLPLYSHWPTSILDGSTYGPFNYLAYLPSTLSLPWRGVWNSVPPAHLSSLLFDSLTIWGLYLLGVRLHSKKFGILCAYLWVACPWTAYVLWSSTDDSLVSTLLVAGCLLGGRSSSRGAASAFIGFTKWAPLALAPLWARGEGRLTPSSLGKVLAGFGGGALICFLPVLLAGDWSALYHNAILFQFSRRAPLSIWGLWGNVGEFRTSSLIWEQRLVELLVGLGALSLAFFPRRSLSKREVVALSGAVLLATLLSVEYLVFTYLVWFLPSIFLSLQPQFEQETLSLKG